MIIPLQQYKDQYGYTMLEFVTPRAGPVLTPRTSSEQLGRGPLGDNAYQISKL